MPVTSQISLLTRRLVTPWKNEPLMKFSFTILSGLLAGLVCFGPDQLNAASPPLALHPDNPHYFHFRGKPAVIIGSGEHYGAVLNQEFDYVAYLRELRAKGLNHTRLFSGTYREVPSSFGISDNTLAPKPEQFLSPWARSETQGEFYGGNKFDLSR